MGNMPAVPGSRPLDPFTSREPWDQPSRARLSSLSEEEVEEERTRSPGESEVLARQAEVLAKDAQKVIYCHPSLSNTPPGLCKNGQFLVNQSKHRLPKKHEEKGRKLYLLQD